MKKRKISCGRKAIADFMLFLLIVVVAAGLIFFMGLFFAYVPLASNIASIQTNLKVYMTNDDVGTELVSLLNSKTGDKKHIELLGWYTTDGIVEAKKQFIDPVEVTMNSSYANYDFAFNGPRSVSFQKNVPATIQDSTKLSIPNCGTSLPAELKEKLKWPLSPASNYITSGFSGREYKGKCDCHGGIDIRSNNEDVYAAATGKVILARNDGDYGNHVIIGHSPRPDGKYEYYTHYAHLSSIDKNLLQKIQEGNPDVTEGTLLGKSGSTGESEAPHLHFEIRDSTNLGDSSSVNPCELFKDMKVSDMKGLSCTHAPVTVCKYVAGTNVRSYETDVPLPGAKSGTPRGKVVFKQWE